MTTVLERLQRGTRQQITKLRDHFADPGLTRVVVNPKFLPGGVKVHHVIPDDLGMVGEHMVWTLIKAIQRGDDVLVIATSYDGKDTTRVTLPARKTA